MKNKKYTLKSDKYRRKRGGYSRLLKLSCASCKSALFLYQKDGPGPLKRLYLDRIVPKQPLKKSLVCKKCKNILGTYYIYPKEKRPAYRLYWESVTKKIIKANQ